MKEPITLRINPYKDRHASSGLQSSNIDPNDLSYAINFLLPTLIFKLAMERFIKTRSLAYKNVTINICTNGRPMLNGYQVYSIIASLVSFAASLSPFPAFRHFSGSFTSLYLSKVSREIKCCVGCILANRKVNLRCK